MSEGWADDGNALQFGQEPKLFGIVGGDNAHPQAQGVGSQRGIRSRSAKNRPIGGQILGDVPDNQIINRFDGECIVT